MSETQPEVQWFIQIADGKKAGPISWEHLKKFAGQKRLLPETKVRSTQPDAVWVPAGTIPDLFGDIEATVPTQTISSEMNVVTEKSEEKATPAEKKESSTPAFSINTTTEQSHSNVAVKPVFKINTKKSVPKENKEEKKSTGIFGFGVQKSQTKTDEKKTDHSVKISEPEKKKTSDQSSSAIKISISTPEEKGKNKEKSSAPATVIISAEPAQETTIITQEELSSETFPESEESNEIVSEITATTNVTETNLQQHGEKKGVQLFPKRKTGIISLLLITLAVLSVLIGGVGGVGVFLLGYHNNLAIFSATLGTIIFLFGMILGVASWFLALLFNQSES
ncbi:MAG: DUF4339 domain-containing protein [Planctomycetaceae bacterium]|jgi:hypothetical protein|nr:DUF4339 domain-containing protein [Planctomycetaceae bacterium]